MQEQEIPFRNLIVASCGDKYEYKRDIRTLYPHEETETRGTRKWKKQEVEEEEESI